MNPTREDNYPTVNMEAIACGTPVVTFDTGGSSECIDENCGCVVACDDIDGLEKVIKGIYLERSYLKDDCLHHAKAFDKKAKFQEYLRLYENCTHSTNAPYNDYWGYQDNLLPKYQKKLGHDVTIIVPNLMHKDGRIVETACGEYVLNDGVRVIRRSYRRGSNRILTNLNSRLEECYSLLVRLNPDFIFFHGLVSTTIFDAIKYKKRINRNCVIVQDNHFGL